MRLAREGLLALGLSLALSLPALPETAPAAKASPSPAAAQSSSAQPSSAQPSSVPSLAAAQAELGAAKDRGPAFASRLKALSEALSPADSLALLTEFAPLVSEGAASKELLLKGGELGLLLGRFDEAAEDFEAAAFRLAPDRDDALLLRAARAGLAAGEADKAGDRAALVLRSASDPGLLAQARLVAAWASLLSGRPAEAKASASLLLSGQAPERREALFLLWAASPAAERPKAAASLSKDYPGSPEADLAAGKSADLSFLPLPHWYLSGLAAQASGPTPAAGSAVQAGGQSSTSSSSSASSSSPSGASSAATKPGAAKLRYYQVGIFSKGENAELLVAELAKKGFAATVEERLVKGQKLEAVLVEAGASPESTLLKLKDAGYEAYQLF